MSITGDNSFSELLFSGNDSRGLSDISSSELSLAKEPKLGIDDSDDGLFITAFTFNGVSFSDVTELSDEIPLGTVTFPYFNFPLELLSESELLFCTAVTIFDVSLSDVIDSSDEEDGCPPSVS